MKGNTVISWKAAHTLLLCSATCSIIAAICFALFRTPAVAQVSNRTLSFAERVAYQRAIEEVYWRHRVWPKERPDPKPSLDAVIFSRGDAWNEALFAINHHVAPGSE